MAPPRRVLLTGGTGFFGRRIAAALAGRGFTVAAPVRPELDLFERASVGRAIASARPDLVVPSAAYYGGLGIISAEPARVFHDNVLMAVHLLDAAGEARVPRFMSIGSA